MAESEQQEREQPAAANLVRSYTRFDPAFSDPSSMGRTLGELRSFDAAVVSYIASMEHSNSERQESRRAVCRALAILVAVLLFGAFYFGKKCAWAWYTAVYFSWVTLSTIGYGDYTPLNRCNDNSYTNVTQPEIVRVWLAFVMFGLVSISYVLATLAEQAAQLSREEHEDASKKFCCCNIPANNLFHKWASPCNMCFFLVLVLIAGSLLFVVSEGWSVGDGFYFAMVTLLTIGYGDQGSFYQAAKNPNSTEAECMKFGECVFFPNETSSCGDCVLSPTGKLVVIVYSFVGLVLVGNLLGMLIAIFKEARRGLESQILKACLKSRSASEQVDGDGNGDAVSRAALTSDDGSDEEKQRLTAAPKTLEEEAEAMLAAEYCGWDQLFWIRLLLLAVFGAIFIVAMLVFGAVSMAIQNQGLTAEGNPDTYWTLQDSFYYAVVTATTIGYGDITPTVLGARIWLIVAAVPMLGFVSFFVGHWLDTLQLIEGSIWRAFRAYNKKRGRTCYEKHPKAVMGWFKFALFLLAFLLVLIVNVAFVLTLAGDVSEIPVNGSEDLTLIQIYFVTVSDTTIGYGDNPTTPVVVRRFTSWMGVINLAIYAYFFVFIATAIEKLVSHADARMAERDGMLRLNEDVLPDHGLTPFPRSKTKGDDDDDKEEEEGGGDGDAGAASGGVAEAGKGAKEGGASGGVELARFGGSGGSSGASDGSRPSGGGDGGGGGDDDDSEEEASNGAAVHPNAATASSD